MLVEILGGELDLGRRRGEEREHLYVRADVCESVREAGAGRRSRARCETPGAVKSRGSANSCWSTRSRTLRKPSTRHGPRRRLPPHPPQSIERGVVLIDGNVRGADRFALSQQALCERVAEWAAAERLPSILVLDHGEQRAWPLGEFAVCTLSGDVQTADDVCVRDALWLRQRGRGVAVATSDVELTRRLRLRRGVRGATEVVSSSAFLQRALLVGDEGRRAARRGHGGASGVGARARGAPRRARGAAEF